jgi:hypothetical protein
MVPVAKSSNIFKNMALELIAMDEVGRMDM